MDVETIAQGAVQVLKDMQANGIPFKNPKAFAVEAASWVPADQKNALFLRMRELLEAEWPGTMGESAHLWEGKENST